MALNDELDALGLLTEPQRRRVFEHVQAEGPCTTHDLVRSLGLGRTLVAFHLGKLVEAGFVEVLPPDRSAAGHGRPAQRYRVSGREVVASVPGRRYDLLAGVLLESVAGHQQGETALASAERAAHRQGVELGRGWRRGRRVRSAAVALERLERLLDALGYLPRRTGGELTVRNCPFDRFRATNTEQVCALNLALCAGYVEGLELDGVVDVALRPSPDTCCTVFGPADVRPTPG